MIKEKLELDILNDYEIERNLYLKEFFTGKRFGPLTGKPSIDRPWLKQFSIEEISKCFKRKTIYNDLIDSSKDNLNNIALEFYGNKITYKELIDNIEKTASSLASIGVKKGDKVSVCMPYLPETIYSIYAINKIGAVINMIDPRINDELITEYIMNANSEVAIIIDKIDDKIERIKTNTNLREVISVPATNSVKNSVLKIPNHFKHAKFTRWNEFINFGKKNVETIPYEPEQLAIIEYTSGTSGKPKGVMLSNDSLAALSHSSRISYKCNVGDKFLLIMPPFIAYGLAIGMHDMLCMGQHLLIIPNFSLEKAKKLLPQLIEKHKPNYMMGVPNFLLFLLDYKGDLDFLKGIVIGGDHLDEKLEKKVRNKFKNLNIYKGWGMTEIASCGVFTKTDVQNPYGSVGIPLLGNIVKIIPINEDGDFDINGPECQYGESGLMFINTKTSALGYYKNEAATNSVFVYDKSGTKWINTGDVFSISEDGYLFFENRIKRIVVRPDGHNIPSNQIEEIASNESEVFRAIVVGVPSKKYNHGKQAALCVKTNNRLSSNEIEALFKNIENNCIEKLQPRDRPKYIISVDNLPLTSNGKIDFNLLEQYAIDTVKDVEINEDSNEMKFVFNNEKTNVKVKKRKK